MCLITLILCQARELTDRLRHVGAFINQQLHNPGALLIYCEVKRSVSGLNTRIPATRQNLAFARKPVVVVVLNLY
jgi:hypothetical protein